MATLKNQIYYFNQQLIKLIPISIVDNKQDSTIDLITSDELILLFQFLQSLFTTTTTAGNDDTIILEIDYLLLLFWESMTNKYQMSLPSYYVGE